MSSAGKRNITSEQAVPLIESDIFSGHEDKKFALGVFSSDDVLSYESNTLTKGYLQLRANVYVDQTDMLEDSVKRPDGTELDRDDERSTHLVVFENRIEVGRVAVFACMRLIEKTAGRDSRLPIEEFFPEAFTEDSPLNSVEVSRFIIMHNKPRNGLIAKDRLIKVGMAHLFENNLGPTFAVVEPEFERNLNMARVPIERIGEPKIVPEYNDINLAVEIDKFEYERRVGKEVLRNMVIPVGSFDYWGHSKQ